MRIVCMNCEDGLMSKKDEDGWSKCNKCGIKQRVIGKETAIKIVHIDNQFLFYEVKQDGEWSFLGKLHEKELNNLRVGIKKYWISAYIKTIVNLKNEPTDIN